MVTGHAKLIEQIQRVGSGFDALNKGLVFRHRGVALYPSEIHMMKTVASNPEVNASGISKILGVTKGAVSQTLSKLETKGIFGKETVPGSKNELRIWLTPFGNAALKGFHKQFASQWSEFGEFLDGLSCEERHVVSRFLDRLNEFLRSLR